MAFNNSKLFVQCGPAISDDEIKRTICWDDDEDPVKELASGVYPTCAGEWRRLPSNDWQFFKDPEVEI